MVFKTLLPFGASIIPFTRQNDRSGSGEGVTGLGDPGLEGWSVQQRLLTMAWFGVFVPFLEEQM